MHTEFPGWAAVAHACARYELQPKVLLYGSISAAAKYMLAYMVPYWYHMKECQIKFKLYVPFVNRTEFRDVFLHVAF